MALRGVAAARIPQPLPFQCSTSAFCAEPAAKLPTAKQLWVLGQATPLRLAAAPLLGFGVELMLQLLPFQCSANVLVVEPFVYRPTAKQLVVVGHATALKVLPVDPLGFGLDVDDHTDAAPAGAAAANTPPATSATETATVENLERRERREEIK